MKTATREMQAVCFYLPVELRAALRVTAARTNVPMSRLISDCLLRDRKVGKMIRHEMEVSA